MKKSGYETSRAGSTSQIENLAHLFFYPEMIEKSGYETSRAGSTSQSENLAHLFFYPEMIEKSGYETSRAGSTTLGPIVKFTHCQQLPTVQTREIVIVGNGQILQRDLMSKINILRS